MSRTPQSIYVQGFDVEATIRMRMPDYNTMRMRDAEIHQESFRLRVDPADVNEVVLTIGDKAVRIDGFAVKRAIDEAIRRGRA